jgi:DNA-directed RNA polymerase sigma subunit (sigma70/sigma32)
MRYTWNDLQQKLAERCTRTPPIDGIRKMVDTIPQSKTRAVINMRYGEGMVLREIGEKLNLTGSRIGYIEARGVRQLKHPSRIRGMFDDQ